MFPRRSLGLPITLAIGMIVLLVALMIGWISLTIVGIQEDEQRTALYVTLLSVGLTFLILMIVGTVIYLALSIKAINLTKRQSNFIDSVTHELKSPIASLKLYLQTLARRSVDEEQRNDFYQFMLGDVERLDQLINHLLDAARIEKPAAPHEATILDLSATLRTIAESVCQMRNVPLETIEFETEPCSVKLRPVDVDIVVRNLLDNALKYAGDPPQVFVKCKLSETGEALVEISDNGAGIPMPLRRKIFGRFVRLGSELERQQPGTGLGLYIVRTLLNRWSGKITVKDRSDGPGTVFELRIPKAIRVENGEQCPES